VSAGRGDLHTVTVSPAPRGSSGPHARSHSAGIRPTPQSDQVHRRERILAAASQQAVSGYEAVRIRAVAAAAEVSASVVYHYFSSKDGLLLECLHNWVSEVSGAVDIGGSEDPGQRLLGVVESLSQQLSLMPGLADAVARAYLHATGAASDQADLVRDKLIQVFADAMGQDAPGCAGHHQQVAALVADVWIANILAIAQNRTTSHDLCRRLEYAVSAIGRNTAHRCQARGFSAEPSADGDNDRAQRLSRP